MGAMIMSLIDRDAAIHNAATNGGPHGRLVHFRIPAPALFAGARIYGENDAPVGDAVDGPVPHQRRGFLTAAACAQVVGPGQSQPFHVAGVELIERAVARFARRETVRQPVVTAFAGIFQRDVVHSFRLLRKQGER